MVLPHCIFGETSTPAHLRDLPLCEGLSTVAEVAERVQEIDRKDALWTARHRRAQNREDRAVFQGRIEPRRAYQQALKEHGRTVRFVEECLGRDW